jgi:hypothetical protein
MTTPREKTVLYLSMIKTNYICILYLQTYFKDKKHFGATDTFVRIDKRKKWRSQFCYLKADTVFCLPYKATCLYNIQEHVEGIGDDSISVDSVLSVFPTKGKSA